MPDHRTTSALPARPRRSNAAASVDILQLVLERLFDAAVATCVFIVPLTMAGIREYGIGLFVCCSCVMAVTWSVRQLLTSATGSPSGPAMVIGVAAVGLVWLQLQPIPNDLLHQLSPFNSSYLTLWGSAEGQILGQSDWQQISVTPEATRGGLVLLIAYVLFFLTLTQRLQSQHDIDRLIRLTGLSAVVMAAIGIGQILVGDGRFLFLIEHPTRSAAFPAKGTFTNQNHFAHFLALGIGPLLWCWQSSTTQASDPSPKNDRRRSRRHNPTASKQPQETQDRRILLFIGIGIALVSVAALLSVSRGGIAVFAIAATIAVCAVIRNWASTLRLVLPVIVFVAATLYAFGTDELNDRWEQVAASESVSDLSHGRWLLWTAVCQAVTEFWPAGSGVGSHADVYPIWLSEQFDVRFSHAECGYLQVLLETGIPGTILLACGICLCCFWCLQGWRRGTSLQRRQMTALAAGLVASLVHSVFDFVWYIPGCMIVTLTIIACLCRTSQLTAPAKEPVRTSVFRLPTLIAAGLLVMTLPATRLFTDSVTRDMTSAEDWTSFRARMLRIGEESTDPVESLNEQLDTMIAELERCVQRNAQHHSAWSALAPLYLHRFELHSTNGDNQMSLQDIRDTIRQADFASHQEEREWLERAFGDDVRDLYRAVHTAHRALRLRPLRSEAYLVLSETAFLTAAPPEALEAVIDQAVRVRPHKPRVLYAAGLLADESGETESAWNKWRHAASLDSQIARKIIERFVDRMPINELMQRLQPNSDAHFELFAAYNRAERPQEKRVIAESFAEAFEQSAEAFADGDVNRWRRSADLLIAAGRDDEATSCLKRVVRQMPQDLATRQRYAKLLAKHGQLREARREFTWLASRMPDNEEIARLLEEVKCRYDAEYHPERHNNRRRSTSRIRQVSHASPQSHSTQSHSTQSHSTQSHSTSADRANHYHQHGSITPQWTPDTNSSTTQSSDIPARPPAAHGDHGDGERVDSRSPSPPAWPLGRTRPEQASVNHAH